MNVGDIVTYINSEKNYFLVINKTKSLTSISRCNKKGELTSNIVYESGTEWLEEVMEVVPEKAIDFSEVV